jgi:hypothetical protein
MQRHVVGHLTQPLYVIFLNRITSFPIDSIVSSAWVMRRVPHLVRSDAPFSSFQRDEESHRVCLT